MSILFKPVKIIGNWNFFKPFFLFEVVAFSIIFDKKSDAT